MRSDARPGYAEERLTCSARTCGGGGERASVSYLLRFTVLGLRGWRTGGFDRGHRATAARARAAPLGRLHLDEPVLRRHELHVRRARGAQSRGGEGHAHVPGRGVRVLEVQLLLEFVCGEYVGLRGHEPGALEQERGSSAGDARVEVSVVRLRRRGRRGFGGFESQVFLEPSGHSASASLKAPGEV